MKRAQLQRLVDAAKDLLDLEQDLRAERGEAEGDDKAGIRKAIGQIERARAELEKAIGAASVRVAVREDHSDA